LAITTSVFLSIAAGHTATQEYPGNAQRCEFHTCVAGARARRRNGRGASAIVLENPARLPGGFAVPNLTGPNALLEARTKFVHEVVAKLLIAAIGLHVAAALKHHFADKDTTLLRMLPFCHDDRRP